MPIRGDRLRRSTRALPRFWFFTDPARTPDPVAVARTLPRGAAVVYRHFGAADRFETARRLRTLPGLVLLIGADWQLATAVRADGVHLPERMRSRLSVLKRAHPGWLVTVAAHSRLATQQSPDADAMVLSPVFPSRSPSAGKDIGPVRAARWARGAPVPVIALGGVTRQRSRGLLNTGFSGVAGIDLFLANER